MHWHYTKAMEILKESMRLYLFILLLLSLLPAHSRADHSVTLSRIEALVDEAWKQGRPAFPLADAKGPALSFVKLSPADPWQVGILQVVPVDAPFEKLVATLDDTAGYVGLFQDLKISERRNEKGPDDFVLFTETSIPIPFVANDRTSAHYTVTRAKNRVKYRFTLVEGNHLKTFTGLIGLEAREGGKSVYWEFDLIEPSYGAGRILPPKKFWKESALSSAQSDWAIKLRTEQPGLAKEKILEESGKLADSKEDEIAEAYKRAPDLAGFLASMSPPAPSSVASPKSPSGPAPSTARPKASGPKSEPKP
jgi:hypothetical protein